MSSILIVINKLSTTASCGFVSDVPPMMIDTYVGAMMIGRGKLKYSKTKLYQCHYSEIKPGSSPCFT